MIDLSIVIPTWNRLWSLPTAVDSCFAAGGNVEVIVVDDGSTDGTWEWLQGRPDVVALRAPKPLLVLQCKRDGLFPLVGMEESLRKLEAIYAKAGAAKAFRGKFYDVPHIFNVEMQEEAFAWLDGHLRG